MINLWARARVWNYCRNWQIPMMLYNVSDQIEILRLWSVKLRKKDVRFSIMNKWLLEDMKKLQHQTTWEHETLRWDMCRKSMVIRWRSSSRTCWRLNLSMLCWWNHKETVSVWFFLRTYVGPERIWVSTQVPNSSRFKSLVTLSPADRWGGMDRANAQYPSVRCPCRGQPRRR